VARNCRLSLGFRVTAGQHPEKEKNKLKTTEKKKH
jgi:hypothetical protein